MSRAEPDPMLPEGASVMDRIALASLGGDGLPPEPGPKTKTGRLRAKGWRILPIPRFWRSAAPLRAGCGGTSAPAITFSTVAGWVVIAPDDLDLPARQFKGRRPAIAWAWGIAFEGREP